jgi:D-cysteine desulfhydrase family pyridoxal phosphate-dependent enzyme
MTNRQDRLKESLARLPRHPLAHYPTPLLPLQNLSKTLGGIKLWIKRDDLISFGFGGNKVRGLEFLLADAINQQSDVLVTGAGVQSNHVRATAAAAAYAGMRCNAVFWGDEPKQADGNFRLTQMLGAEVVYTGDTDRASVDRGIDELSEELQRKGERPYAIQRGGACAIGSLGHVLAAYELYEQCRMLGIMPEAVMLAAGSGGTHAGWLLGTRALDSPWNLESFTVSRESESVRLQISRLATEAAALLGLNWCFNSNDAIVHDGFIGAGYGIPSREAAAAIRLLARSEGVLLDPTYTGKAMAGLLDYLHRGAASYRSLVFMHTGGEPAFFAGDGEWLM